MKKFEKLVLVIFILTFLVGPDVKSQNLPEVIALREIEMHKGTNELIFLNYYNQWCDLITEYSKGASGWVMKGDRGNRFGEYVFAWTFNYKSTRDYYFPSGEMSNYPQWNAVLSQFNFHAPEQPLVDSMYSYTDFIVLGYPKMIAPQLGEIIAVRYFEVEEEKRNVFEAYVENTYHIAYQKHIDGYYNYVLKGDRGDKVGTYVLLTVFDTADRRNSYYPVPGEPASDGFMEQWENVADVETRFRSYLPEGIEFDYTDYIVVYK
jgi:hypothetical protein